MRTNKATVDVNCNDQQLFPYCTLQLFLYLPRNTHRFRMKTEK